ncbi:hypothetical protein C9374_007435 [Naegleria lovaniensis]|uniref:RGS domain-containing protein n=1 Tax=Naegleria lovaniensis TaxID=51637 RepID=A0AA88GMU0_NAELO|nr:uncharacterized protein C9374_007435 [Naegleria lovaniensis]KAG2379296.1 hypothetical protein C9374_007435 [Naegleria lovaniensis]
MISQHSSQKPPQGSSDTTMDDMISPSTPEDFDQNNMNGRSNATCQNFDSVDQNSSKPSSGRKTSSSKSTKASSFDPSTYMIIYSEAMKCKDFRKTFCDFLKLCRHEESIEFLNLVEQYKSDYDKSIKEMGGWMNNLSSGGNNNLMNTNNHQNLFLTSLNSVSTENNSSPTTTTSPHHYGKQASSSSSVSTMSCVIIEGVRKTSNAITPLVVLNNHSTLRPTSGMENNNQNNTDVNASSPTNEKITLDQLLIQQQQQQHSSLTFMESTEVPSPQQQQLTTSSSQNSFSGVSASSPQSASSPLSFQIFSQASLRNGSNVKLARKNVKLLFDSAKTIVENYIHIGCDKELNLGATQRSILHYWNEVFEHVEHFSSLGGYSDTSSSNSDGSSSTSASNGNGNSNRTSSPVTSPSSIHFMNAPRKESYFHTMCNLVFTQLDPEKLFGQALFNVNLDLKLDQFPRFVRSDQLMKFLKEKGESYTRSIAVDISKGFKGDMRWKPNDLKDRIITDDYIYFGFNVADDTPDWELIYNTTSPYLCHAYISKTPYVFGSENMKGMKLAKMVLHIPFSLDVVWNCYCNTEFAKKFDKMANTKQHILSRHIPPAKQPPYSVENPPYALQFASNALDLLFMLKTRQMSYSYTAIYDPLIDMYMFLAHSAEFEQQDNIPQDIGVQAHGLVYYMFYRVSEKLTRIVHIIYSDLNLPISSDTVMKLIWKKRVKEHQKGFADILKEMTSCKNGSMISMDQLTKMEDGHNTKLCVEENRQVYGNRSWYQEWMNLKKEKLQHF